MARKSGVGKLPRRPKGGRWGTSGFGEGWTRAHWFDQYPGQPKRKAKRGKA